MNDKIEEKPKQEEKLEKVEVKPEKIEAKQEEKKEEKVGEKKVEEKKAEEKKGKKKVEEKKEVKKKEEAVVNGWDLDMSTKHAVSICNMIRNKSPLEAITMLEKVLRKELAVPYKGEIPHRKRGRRIGKLPSGRYPKKASQVFIKMLRNLIANANINGLDTENIKITIAKANIASRPIKPSRIAYGRKRLKRTHVNLIVKEIPDKERKQEKTVEKQEQKKEVKEEKKGE
jgi:ribosomal protein L22